MKVNHELVKHFYYGEDLRNILCKIIVCEDIEFDDAGYDGDDKGNIQKIEFSGYIELDDETKIDFEVTGDVSRNLITFKNNYNDLSIVYKIKSGEFIY